MHPVRFVSVFAALLLGIVVLTPAQARAEQARQLRVMTFNVNYGNPDPDHALDTIAKANVDLVLLQEITSEWKRKLAARFDKDYPHQVFRIHTRAAGGLAVLSKHPISDEEVMASPERGWFPAQRLVVDTGLGALQVLHVHLRPAIDQGSWIKGFMTTPPLRRKEIETYWKKIMPHMTTIVAGDFNEDPTGLALAFLQKFKLARVPTPAEGPTTWRFQVHSKAGWSDLLKMDIDHVVIDDTLEAHDAEVIDAGASDHRPVIVTLRRK